MKNKKMPALEAGEYLLATTNNFETAELLKLTKMPFKIGFRAGDHSYGNDYGVDARVGGRIPGEGSNKKYQLPMLSKEHCGINLEEGVRYLYDLGSRTGTFLNGKRVTAGEKLNDGDVIGLIPSDEGFLLELEYVVK